MQKNNNYLLLSLGHNSSALFMDCSDNDAVDRVKPIGYENERITRIKSDSSFPREAINEIIKTVGLKKVLGCKALISTWFEGSNGFPSKYISEKDMEFLETLCSEIGVTSSEFTHHDAHAYSAYAFLESHASAKRLAGDGEKAKYVFCLVADGFGTNREVISLYKKPTLSCDPNDIEKVRSLRGYSYSLGLLYQYATSFCGMKENQDEYKFLGYEAYAYNYLRRREIDGLIDMSREYADRIVRAWKINATKKENIFLLNDCRTEKGPIPISVGALEVAKTNVRAALKDVFSKLKIEYTPDSFGGRVAVAVFVQNAVEKAVSGIIDFEREQHSEFRNLCLAGGCFYNVKLNNHILNSLDGFVSIMPLAGDQGAPLGMYVREKGLDSIFFGDLCFGPRDFSQAKKLFSDKENVIYVDDYEYSDEVFRIVAKLIADGNIVNVVRRNMEFGPRALCNTSTLFLPTSDNLDLNNKINGRNEVMPCAPVVSIKNYKHIFSDVNGSVTRLIGSAKYMICTLQYNLDNFGASKQHFGVMHDDPYTPDIYTGRPQLVHADHWMYGILEKVETLTGAKCLVNTSFNTHGNPIVFDMHSILQNFTYQKKNLEALSSNKNVYLIIMDF